MTDIPKELWGLIGAAFGGIVTFITSLFSTSAKLRAELRAENVALKERVGALEKSVQALIDEQIEWRRERVKLKRDLDKRDDVIVGLQHEISLLRGRMDVISEPMGA